MAESINFLNWPTARKVLVNGRHLVLKTGGMVMNHWRSIHLPSAKFARVREPGRNGRAVTGLPELDVEVEILLQSARPYVLFAASASAFFEVSSSAFRTEQHIPFNFIRFTNVKSNNRELPRGDCLPSFAPGEAWGKATRFRAGRSPPPSR